MGDFANDSIKGLEELLKALKGTKDEIKEIIKLQEKRAKEIDITKAQAKEMAELAKAAKQVAIAEQQIQKVNEQEAKTLQQLEKVKAEELKTSQQKLKLDIATKKEKERLNKLAEKERKDAEKLNSEYAKQSKRLNDLRKKYKDLRLTTGKNTKETKKLKEEIEELDKTLKDVDAEVGQFQRNVGNYPKTTESAKSGFKSLGAFIGGIFLGTITKSRDTTREFQNTLEKVSNGIRIVAQEMITLFKKQVLPTIDNLALKFEKASLKLEAFTNGIGGDDGINARLSQIDAEMKKNTKTMDEYVFSWEDLSEILDKTNKNIDDRQERQDRLIDDTARLNDEIQKLQITEQVLEANIGNSNFSMQQREAQVLALIKVQDEIISKQRELAEEEFKNAATSIRNDLLRRKLIKTNEELSDQDIKSLSFLKDKSKADAISIENLNKLTTATTRLNEVEAQSQLQDATALKERLDNRRDLFEQLLDFTLDISDRQKAVNERIIASDQQTVQEKFKTLAETEGILDRSYQEQIRLTEDFIKESAELRGLDADQQKALENFDLDRIVNLEDEKEIREEMIKAGIADEKTQNRIREIIIERKAALQDVLDLQEEVLAQAREEQMTQEDAEFALRESRRQIAADNADFETQQRIEDFEETEKFNQSKLDSAKKALEEEKNLQKELIIEQKTFELERAETSEDRIRIEEEEKQALLEIDREYYEAVEDLDDIATEKQKENAQEVLEQKAEIFSKLTAALQTELAEQNARELESIDKELDDTEKGIARQEELAAKGLENTLAFEKEQLAEANLKKIEAERETRQKEEVLQMASILGESYIARLKEGEDTSEALAGASADAFIYRELARALVAGFAYDGVEDTGESGGLDNKGGKLWMLHPHERVMSRAQNEKVGDISNDELANLAYNYRIGIPTGESKEVVSSNVMSEKVANRIVKAIEQQPFQQINVDELGNIIETITDGNIRKVTKLKTRPRL